MPPGYWSTFRPLSWECSQKDTPHQSSLGYSGHLAEPSHLRSLYSSENWFDIQGNTNFTAANFVNLCHAVNSLDKLPFLLLVLEISLFQSLLKIHDHR